MPHTACAECLDNMQPIAARHPTRYVACRSQREIVAAYDARPSRSAHHSRLTRRRLGGAPAPTAADEDSLHAVAIASFALIPVAVA